MSNPFAETCVQCGRPFEPGDRWVEVPPKRPDPKVEVRLRVHTGCESRWNRDLRS